MQNIIGIDKIKIVEKILDILKSVFMIIPKVIEKIKERKKAFPKIIIPLEETKPNKTIKIHINKNNVDDEIRWYNYCLGKFELKNIGKNFHIEKILINNIPFKQYNTLDSNEVVCIEIYNYNRKDDLSYYNIEDFSIIISNEFEKCFICTFSFHKEGLYYNFELTNISKIHKKP